MSLFERLKEFSELFFWRLKYRSGQAFHHAHYAYFFTEFVGLSTAWYKHKSILDIGCGPRGSLEWADMCKERIGLDPLAEKYQRLFRQTHRMKYVSAYSEAIPFEDGYFDLVSCFNALDHVHDLSLTCHELKRVLKSGGILIVVCDIHAYPTLTEPQQVPWDLDTLFFTDCKVLEKRVLERKYKTKFYENLRLNKSKKKPSGEGILYLKLEKN